MSVANGSSLSNGGPAIVDGEAAPALSSANHGPPLHTEKSDDTERDRKGSHSSVRERDTDRKPSEHRPSDSASTSRRGSELKPIGIINEQNTCFLNSTFQAVSRAHIGC